MTQGPALSVIVPFYNEEDSIGRMHAAIVAAVEPLGVPFEMVFVDDGSRDRHGRDRDRASPARTRASYS